MRQPEKTPALHGQLGIMGRDGTRRPRKSDTPKIHKAHEVPHSGVRNQGKHRKGRSPDHQGPRPTQSEAHERDAALRVFLS